MSTWENLFLTIQTLGPLSRKATYVSMPTSGIGTAFILPKSDVLKDHQLQLKPRCAGLHTRSSSTVAMLDSIWDLLPAQGRHQELALGWNQQVLLAGMEYLRMWELWQLRYQLLLVGPAKSIPFLASLSKFHSSGSSQLVHEEVPTTSHKGVLLQQVTYQLYTSSKSNCMDTISSTSTQASFDFTQHIPWWGHQWFPAVGGRAECSQRTRTLTKRQQQSPLQWGMWTQAPWLVQ